MNLKRLEMQAIGNAVDTGCGSWSEEADRLYNYFLSVGGNFELQIMQRITQRQRENGAALSLQAIPLVRLDYVDRVSWTGRQSLREQDREALVRHLEVMGGLRVALQIELAGRVYATINEKCGAAA